MKDTFKFLSVIIFVSLNFHFIQTYHISKIHDHLTFFIVSVVVVHISWKTIFSSSQWLTYMYNGLWIHHLSNNKHKSLIGCIVVMVTEAIKEGKLSIMTKGYQSDNNLSNWPRNVLPSCYCNKQCSYIFSSYYLLQFCLFFVLSERGWIVSGSPKWCRRIFNWLSGEILKLTTDSIAKYPKSMFLEICL